MANAVRPQCRPGQQSVFGSARHELIKVACAVDAQPAAGLTFRWQLNTSLELVDVPAANALNPTATTSVVHHRVQSERDYGALLCWARNALGEQHQPCIFYVHSAGKKQNKMTKNRSISSVY